MDSVAFTDRWFYKTGDAKAGPVSTDQLRNMLRQGAVPSDSRVWRDGMEAWLPAAEVHELLPTGFLHTSSSYDSYTKSVGRRWATRATAAGIICLLTAAAILSFIFSGSKDDLYYYSRVAGSVLYEDGQAIPADTLMLTFIPLAQPKSPRIHPRPGLAAVDPNTGTFKSASSRRPGDGLVQGRHRVLVTGNNRLPLTYDLVPIEYTDFKTTPLEIDTDETPLNLKIRRPLPNPRKEGGGSPTEAAK
jgi:hypothetical protein